MSQTRLRSKFSKDKKMSQGKSVTDKEIFICMSLLRKSKKTNFFKLHNKVSSDYGEF